MYRLLLPILLILTLIGSAGCATTTDEGAAGEPLAAESTGAADEAGTAEDEGAADAEADEGEDADATSAPGRGMAHGRMSDQHHREMLDQGVSQGLITEGDATFFLATHAILDESSPQPMDEGIMEDETKKALQRARVQAAVTAGSLSEADGDRFTTIHDILVDNGLMDE